MTDRYYETGLIRRLNDELLTPRQRKTLHDLNTDMVINECAIATRYNNVRIIGNLGKEIQKPYEDITRKDIETFLSKEMADTTRLMHKIIVKSFYRVLNGLPEGEYPENVAWIVSKSILCKVTKSDLITGDELNKMIYATPSPQDVSIGSVIGWNSLIAIRDSAMVATLWESAFRNGEFLGIRIGDIEYPDFGFRLTNKLSKTQSRTIPIALTAGYLARWLKVHPLREDPEAPLWPSLSKNRYGMKIDRNATLANIVRRAARLGGVRKKIYPHIFRHSRLTDLVRMGMREGALRKYAGWSPTSNMPSVYVHLSGIDVEMAALRTSGVKMDPEKPLLELKTCPKCGLSNIPNVIRCERCEATFYRLISGEPDFQDIIQMQKDLREQLTRVDQLIERRQVNSIPHPLVQ